MSCNCERDQAKLQENILKKINAHPCYSQNAHKHYARIHVAVAPACNIQCNYCNRKYDCSNESRPGVTSCKLTPQEAVKKALYVGGSIKQLSVVGIAGPGDALANPKQTFETFRLLERYAPDIKLCLSTNGLNIEKYIDEILRCNIEHITVTMNSVDESGGIGAKIYPWVYYEGKRYYGEEAARVLLRQQLRGIELLVKNDILVKVNSVLIPNVNEEELPKVAKKVKEMGVFIFNIMPLISKPEHGTKFALEGVKSADHRLLMKVQEACETDVKLMRHCRQCRADAVGLLGEDRSDEFFKKDFADKSFEELQMHYNIKNRREAHRKIEEWRGVLKAANEKALMEEAKKYELSSTGETKLVAVTSESNGLINDHFGSAEEFLIYEAGDKAIKFIMPRRIDTSYCKGPKGCGTYVIDEIKKALSDCDILLTQKIGECPKKELESLKIICDEDYANEPIEISVLKAVKKHFSFEKLQVC